MRKRLLRDVLMSCLVSPNWHMNIAVYGGNGIEQSELHLAYMQCKTVMRPECCTYLAARMLNRPLSIEHRTRFNHVKVSSCRCPRAQTARGEGELERERRADAAVCDGQRSQCHEPDDIQPRKD